MADRRAGIGFLGTGFMGQLAHLSNYADNPDCAVVAVAEIRPRLARAVAEKYGVRKVYADHRDLLADPDVQAVVCSQPWHNNYPLGKQVLAAGKSLITEKPMVTRLDEGQELVDLAKQKGVIYAVGFMKRYDPGVQLARQKIQELIQTGELGALRMVDAYCYMGDWLQNVGRPVTVDEDTQAPPVVKRYPDHLPPARQDAYDYLINVFAHNVNLIRYLLPSGEMTVAHGLFHGQVVSINLTSQEVVISLRGSPVPSHDWNEETRFVFDQGHLIVRTPAPMNRQAVASVTIYRATPPVREARELFADVDWGFRRQARSFVAAVLGGAPPLAPAEDCLKDVAILEDVMRKATFA
jgi:predicted dehydrogenase